MIYLYLKTHKKTGLKYLGKTTSKDPHSYKGSGRRWKSHIKKHGYDVNTEILFESNDPKEIRKMGIYYSLMWDVVHSSDFANLKIEEGDGGDTSQCENYKLSMGKRNTSGCLNPMYGRSAITEQNIRWYNNGKENIYVPAGTEPKGFTLGRIINYKKPHTEETKQKLKMYNTKKCIDPRGQIFNSRTEAAKHYGISPPAIGGLISRGVSGWKWL